MECTENNTARISQMLNGPQNQREACGLLAAITSFDFIISFMTIYQFLFHLEGITVKIQSTSLDILKAYDMVSILQMLVSILQIFCA